jgi:hypothetical protein
LRSAVGEAMCPRIGTVTAAPAAAVQPVTAVDLAALFVAKLFIIGLLTTSPASAQSRPNNNLSELGRLIRLTSDADRQSDFKTAVASAEACVALRESMPSGYYGYCENYLGKALLRGNGVARDARRGFALIKKAAEAYPDADWALDLAEAYLNGDGVPPDPVEAAVIAWRVQHGASSVYNSYWGMCLNCDELWRHAAVLDERLNSELAPNQKQQARGIAAERFPEIAKQVRRQDTQQDTQMFFIATALFALIASAIWWRRRRRTLEA